MTLPAKFPLLLVQGVEGIAVDCHRDTPTQLQRVIDAAVYICATSRLPYTPTSSRRLA
ncbi:hypothetical protein [Muribaculum intestinale]|uniref:hypothetical protein n=1 Tax=Muribaculum intestinale TaxID=1796646 RepID=UPI003F665E0C